MDVPLTPALEKLIQRELESGRYASASEVVREALSLLAKRALETHALREQVNQSLAEARRGELVDGEEAFRSVRRRGRSAQRRPESR